MIIPTFLIVGTSSLLVSTYYIYLLSRPVRLIEQFLSLNLNITIILNLNPIVMSNKRRI